MKIQFDMYKRIAFLFIACVALPELSVAQQAFEIDPKEVEFSEYRHKELPEGLLKRIRSTTDVFESIDGISYEMAVDLYKRDIDPEANLRIWEEMARAYREFCKSRCKKPEERKDVYQSLLLRSMFSIEEALKRVKLSSLQSEEAASVMKLYRLPAQPIGVIKSE